MLYSCVLTSTTNRFKDTLKWKIRVIFGKTGSVLLQSGSIAHLLSLLPPLNTVRPATLCCARWDTVGLISGSQKAQYIPVQLTTP